jgi:hypothetical protein
MEVRGWSAAEKARAAQIFEHAENSKHPHVKIIERFHFWLLLLVVFFGNLCFTVLALPVLLFASEILGMSLMLLLGVCMGMLFVHALRSLRVPRLHHMIGFVVLVLISLVAKTYVITLLQERFKVVPGAHAYSAFLLALPFVIGMIIPYATERRLHGSA